MYHYLAHACKAKKPFNHKYGDGDVAQVVQRQTSTLLMQVRFPGVARDFSPRVTFQCRLLDSVHTPPCTIA